MGSASRFAVALALAFGAASLPVAAPASAQNAAPSLSKEERAALLAAETALNARDYPAATSAIAAAQSAARGRDARYYVARLQLRLARESANLGLEAQAIDALLASGMVPQSEVGLLQTAQAQIALRSATTREQRQRVEAMLARALEAAPSAETALTLAQLKMERRRDDEAVVLLDRAIDLAQASGQPVPESWFRRGLTLASMLKLGPQVLELNREWIAAYPTPQNWRDAVLLYRDFAAPDAAAMLDSTRLRRLAKGLAGERDYMEAAEAFAAAGLPAEAKSLFEEAVAQKMVDPTKASFKAGIAASTKAAAAARGKLAAQRTAALAAATGAPALEAGDQQLSFADYAAAIELYRAALQKGGIDPGIANTRLGIALALAGQRAEAEAAFRAVTGSRAELAGLWLAWLAGRL